MRSKLENRFVMVLVVVAGTLTGHLGKALQCDVTNEKELLCITCFVLLLYNPAYIVLCRYFLYLEVGMSIYRIAPQVYRQSVWSSVTMRASSDPRATARSMSVYYTNHRVSF